MRFRDVKSRCSWFALGTLVVLWLSSLPVAQAQTSTPTRRVRIAILDFDYATVYSNSAAIFGTNVDAGKGIGDLLVTDLVKDGTYSIIERKALDKILTEQNFSNSERADANSAAKIGRLLGVDAIVVGSITQFGNENKHENVGGGGGGFGRFGVGGFGHKSSKAVVGLTARLVSVDTAEILAVAEGKGESKREGVSLLGGGGGWHGWGGGAVDFGSSDFQQTIIGEAIKQATDGLAAELISSSGKIQTRTISVTGIVAAVDSGSIILNIGSRAGLKVGDQLTVEHITREVKDPATGKVLRRLTSAVGIVMVTDVDEQSAVCSIVKGTGFQEGDIVKTVTQ
jgi:curli biogenesis system outer membrane secretion channel CsgG